MPNIQGFEAGNIGLRPNETGTSAREGVARRIAGFSNQQASAVDMLARETSRLGGDTQRLGSETARLGSETAALGAEKGAAMADMGRRVGSDIEYAGGVAIKYLEHQDISRGAPAFANLTQVATQKWNDTVKNADPNDPTVASKFLTSLDEPLTKFKENGFVTEAGQKWAEAHTDALRQHMAEKTMGDMATLAGHAAVVNQQQSINALSATVHADPSSLDFSLAALKSSTEGMIATSPNLTGTQAASARSEILQKGAESIVKSAAIGYIEKTGSMPPWATDPKYSKYINGAELSMFEKQAKAQAKVDALTTKQTEIATRQLNERKAEGAANQSLTNNVKIDPTTSRPVVNPQFFKDAIEIAKMPDAPQGLARTLIDWGESQQNKDRKIVDDPATRQGLTDRLFDPTNPTTRQDLMKAQIDGKLSDHSFQAMERLVTELETSPLKGPAWQATAAAAKDALIVTVPGLPGKDTKGTANYATFMQAFVPQYLAKSRAGTLEPNALDVKDPNSMISKAMAPFKRTPAQRMSDYVEGAGGLSINEKGDVSGNVNKPAASSRKIGNVPVPAALGGIATLQYNADTKLWRDQTSGMVYDSAGNQVKR